MIIFTKDVIIGIYRFLISIQIKISETLTDVYHLRMKKATINQPNVGYVRNGDPACVHST